MIRSGPEPGWRPNITASTRLQCHTVTLRESHLEADNVAEKFPGGVADHGDSSDDSVLAEEAAKDHVPLPDIGQIPGIITN